MKVARYLSPHPSCLSLAHSLSPQMCENIGKAYGCTIKLSYFHGYPATINEPKASVDFVADSARKVAVADGAVSIEFVPTMGAEDFSFFLNSRPVRDAQGGGSAFDPYSLQPETGS